VRLRVWQQLKDKYIRNPDFNEDFVMKKSKAAGGLLCWVLGVYIYSGLVLGQDVQI